MSGSGPKGEIMGGQGEGRVGEGLLWPPQPTLAPPSGEPRSSEGGLGKTKSLGPLGPPTPKIKFLGR